MNTYNAGEDRQKMAALRRQQLEDLRATLRGWSRPHELQEAVEIATSIVEEIDSLGAPLGHLVGEVVRHVIELGQIEIADKIERLKTN